MEFAIGGIFGIIFVVVAGMHGCYDGPTKQEILKNKQDTVLECKKYCSELSSSSFTIGRFGECSCQFNKGNK